MANRPLCGGCPECLAIIEGILNAPAEPVRGATKRPTAAQLERHAKRFGPEGIEATAKELGVEVKVERPARKRGARGLTLKERVAQHVANGHGVDVVAELENLSPSRARRIIEEVSS